MGVVTGVAVVVFKGAMYVLPCSLVGMTALAILSRDGQEEVVVIRGVGIVASGAVFRHANLSVHPVFFTTMTFPAERIQRPWQETFPRSGMGVMTPPALAIAHGRVDDLSLERIMTLKTEIWRGFCQLGCRVREMHIVADRALFILDGLMHERLGEQALVPVLSLSLRTDRKESEKNN